MVLLSICCVFAQVIGYTDVDLAGYDVVVSSVI
jgi:hypothetical protein